MKIFHSTAVCLSTLFPLVAPMATGQDPGGLKPPPGWFLAVDVTDTEVMEQALEQTAVGRLMEADEIKPLIEKVEARAEERQKRIEELRALAKRLGVEPDLTARLNDAIQILNESHTEAVQVYLYFPEGDAMMPAFVIVLTPHTDAAAAVATFFAETVSALDKEKGFQKAKDAGAIDGKPVHLFTSENEFAFLEELWLCNPGESYVIGIGGKELIAGWQRGVMSELAEARDRTLGAGGSGFTVTLLVEPLLKAAAKEMPRGDHGRFSGFMEASGLAAVQSLTYGMSIEGNGVRENLFVALPGAPTGLLAACTTGHAAPPTHPMPAPALMRMGGAVDLEKLFATVDAISQSMEDDPPPVEPGPGPTPAAIAGALTGGMSFGISAPARGGMIPRLTLALGVKDGDALHRVLTNAQEALTGIGFETRKFQEVDWTSVKIPNNPAPLVPSYAVIGDALYFAETPQTLKALIRQHGGDAPPALAVDDAPPALPPVAAPGALSLDVRWDNAAIFALIYDTYWPTVQLMMNQAIAEDDGTTEPLVEVGEFPDSEVLLPHLGTGRGGMAKVTGGLLFSAASNLGDPVMAAIAATYAPMTPMIMHQDLLTESRAWEQRIGKKRLQNLWSALQTWRSSFGGGSKFPNDLGELFTRGLLEDEDALLMPSDEKPATVEYEDEDGEIIEVRSSFKYVPNGKLKAKNWDLWSYNSTGVEFSEVEWNDTEKTVLLYEANRTGHGGRLIMCSDGTLHHVDEDSFQGILGGK